MFLGWVVGKQARSANFAVRTVQVLLLAVGGVALLAGLATLAEIAGQPRYAARARRGHTAVMNGPAANYGEAISGRGASLATEELAVPDGQIGTRYEFHSGAIRVCYRVGRFSGRVYPDQVEYCKKGSGCESCPSAQEREWREKF